MDDSLTEDKLREAIRLTIDSNSHMVKQWLKNQPGSWGYLAGKAVLDCRQQVGRRLTDIERHTAWRKLWNTLSELKRDLSLGNDT